MMAQGLNKISSSMSNTCLILKHKQDRSDADGEDENIFEEFAATDMLAQLEKFNL